MLGFAHYVEADSKQITWFETNVSCKNSLMSTRCGISIVKSDLSDPNFPMAIILTSRLWVDNRIFCELAETGATTSDRRCSIVSDQWSEVSCEMDRNETFAF
jgi:hypothetical protein